MQLKHGQHLAYSTNVHGGQTWHETFEALKTHTDAVRERVCPHAPFGIGLCLSNRAALKLSDRFVMQEFQRWLDKNHCYVFTMNGFSFGQFHEPGAKERAYLPDWTSPERLAYTNLLFDLLAQLLPAGVEGSVSTLPGSFKEFHPSPEALKAIRQNLWRCVEHAARVSELSGRKLRLALEPEPMCLLESSAEVIHCFERFRAEHPRDARLEEHLSVNYDACHFAVGFEEPGDALLCLVERGIPIGKIHLSCALKVRPTAAARAALQKLDDAVFLHQVVICQPDGQRFIYRDLPDALAGEPLVEEDTADSEWRIHFHVPLQAPAVPPLEDTRDHLLGVLDLLAENPGLCRHLELETGTWEVLPPEWRLPGLADQLAGEYTWTLAQLRARGLA